jgi:hypothetical protein
LPIHPPPFAAAVLASASSMLVAYIDRVVNGPELALPWTTFSHWSRYDATTPQDEMHDMHGRIMLRTVLYFCC